MLTELHVHESLPGLLRRLPDLGYLVVCGEYLLRATSSEELTMSRLLSCDNAVLFVLLHPMWLRDLSLVPQGGWPEDHPKLSWQHRQTGMS